MYDWFNLPYERFIENAEELRQDYLKKSDILKHSELNEDGQKLYRIISEFEEYYCFAHDVFNTERSMDTKNNIRHVNLRNVSFTTMYLVADALQLMYKGSLYGANIISRTILENTVILLVLACGDNDMSEKYHEWQKLSKRRINKPAYGFIKDLTKKQELKKEYDEKEFEDFREKFKKNDQWKNDYGWAYGFSKEENGEPKHKFGFDDLANVVFKDSVIVYKYLNSIVHMTSFQVHSDEINEYVYNNKFIAKNYLPTFQVILWALGYYIFVQGEVIKERYLESIETFEKINKYYIDKCNKVFELIEKDDQI